MELQLFLMQFVYSYAKFYGVNDADLLTFENRTIVLEKIKHIDSTAYLVLRDFIEGQINLHNTINNEQLKTKSLIVWKAGQLIAKEQAYSSILWLHKFSRENGIALTGLMATKE